MYRLRRAGKGDAPAASLVAAASFLETFAGILPGADIVSHVTNKSSPAAFDGWIADPASVVTLAEHSQGDAPVGYTVLTTPDEVGAVEAHDIELRRIYALLPTRGTGLGAALMDRAVDDARAVGARRLLLGVYSKNHVARAFYERQGFTMTETRRFKVGATWHDDCVYARLI